MSRRSCREEARLRLDADVFAEACDRFEAWHAAPDGPCPQIGIRATVGLGKSADRPSAFPGAAHAADRCRGPLAHRRLHALARARRGSRGRLARERA